MLSELFKDSWKEYKTNFKSLITFILVFVIIPTLILYSVFGFAFLDDFEDYTIKSTSLQTQIDSIISNQNLTDEEIVTLGNEYGSKLISLLSGLILPISIGISIGLVVLLLGIFSFAGISFVSNKKKYNYKDIVNTGKKRFGRALAFVLLYILYVLLVVTFAGILGAIISLVSGDIAIFVISLTTIVALFIFFVYFTFAVYIYSDGKRFFMSLNESLKLVRGRWWKTLGYVIAVGLAVGIITEIISAIILLIVSASGLNGLRADYYISIFIDTVLSAVGYTYMFIFLRNMYHSYRSKGKQKQ